MNKFPPPIETALIGFGFSGRIFHAPFLKALPQYSLGCVVSSQVQKVNEFLPETKVEANFDTILKDPNIELVVIATPNDTHYSLAKAALEVGKNVVIDKPFTVKSKEAIHLMDIAKCHQKHLTVFHNRRWDGDFLTIKDVIEKGLLGDIYLYEAHYHRYRPHARPDRWKEGHNVPGSGTLYDLGAHLIDQALQLFGPPESVQADVARQRPGSLADDYFHLTFTYGGKRVILKSSSLVYNPGPRYQIHGTQGSFLKSGIDPQEEDLMADKNPLDFDWGVTKADQDGLLSYDSQQLKISTLPGNYGAFYTQLAEAIWNNKPAPVLAEDALQVIQLIEKCMDTVLIKKKNIQTGHFK
ncbi:MAG: oxidoreductase [Alphaproteobacteria bacterium]|nr:oxidoreductase [Alphaproteobacteria bacterium]